MAKIKIGWKDLAMDDQLDYASTIKTSLTGNANFTVLDPPLADLSAALAAAETAKAEVEALRAAAATGTAAYAEKLALLGDVVSAIGADVEKQSNGNPVMMLSSGFKLRAEPTRITEITQVLNLSAASGDDEGEVDLNWDPVRGAKYYEIELSDDANNLALWGNPQTSLKSKHTAAGLTSGAKKWFRVRAVGSNGKGPWSDPATKVVP